MMSQKVMMMAIKIKKVMVMVMVIKTMKMMMMVIKIMMSTVMMITTTLVYLTIHIELVTVSLAPPIPDK